MNGQSIQSILHDGSSKIRLCAEESSSGSIQTHTGTKRRENKNRDRSWRCRKRTDTHGNRKATRATKDIRTHIESSKAADDCTTRILYAIHNSELEDGIPISPIVISTNGSHGGA